MQACSKITLGLVVLIAVTAAFVGAAVLFAPAAAASAAPGDLVWGAKTWTMPQQTGYEIKSQPVLVRGPGGDLWLAVTGMYVNRDRNFVLLRYSQGGTRRWTFETGSAPTGDYVNDVAVSSGKYAYLAGSIYDPATKNALWTVKVSPGGKRVWARRMNSQGTPGVASGAACALDSHGNVYVVGELQRTSTGADVVLVKYSPAGKRRWVKYLSAGGAGEDVGVDIAIDAADRIFIAGTMQTLLRGKDVLVARYATTGALKWKRIWDDGSASDDVCTDLAVSSAGVAVCGSSTASGKKSLGLVLTAKIAMGSSDSLGYHLSSVSPYHVRWESVGIDAAGDVVAGGQVTDDTLVRQFAYAKWPASGPFEFVHDAPVDRWAGCQTILLTPGGALFTAGWVRTPSSPQGIRLDSRAGGAHDWSTTTADRGSATSIAVSADHVYVAGTIDETTALWKYER